MRLLLVILLILTQCVAAANLKTSVDQNRMRVGEPFQLKITSDQMAQNVTPDLSVLEKNFLVNGTSTNTQIMVLNGNTTTLTEWVIVLSPRAEGIITIPAIPVGNNQSKPIQITVLKGDAAPAAKNQEKSVLMQAEVDDKEPYQQSQIIYTLRLLYSVTVSDYTMTQPEVTNAIVHDLNLPRQYQEKINGRLYQVYERKYAIFPQQSGEIAIFSPEFIAIAGADDAYAQANPFFVNRGQRIRIQAPTLKLKVKPALAAPAEWLPVKNLELSESWSAEPSDWQVGVPVTRTLTFKATGMSAEQLPKLTLKEIPGFNVYTDKIQNTDQVLNNSILGIRQQKISYIPTEGGSHTIPELSVKWFNTKSKTWKTETLPARTVVLAGEKNPISTPSPYSERLPSLSTTQNWLPWIIAGFAFCAWIVTLILWRRPAKLKITTKIKLPKNLYKSIKYACQQNQASLVQSLILEFHHEPSLGRVKNLFPNTEYAAELTKLEAALYAPKTAAWQGENLWQAFSKAISQRKSRRIAKKPPLPPLYPDADLS